MGIRLFFEEFVERFFVGLFGVCIILIGWLFVDFWFELCVFDVGLLLVVVLLLVLLGVEFWLVWFLGLWLVVLWLVGFWLFCLFGIIDLNEGGGWFCIWFIVLL